MGWRILQITKPCKLHIQNKQFVYDPVEGDALKLPLEDISVIILENKQISLNNALISELAENDIVLFSCNDSHLPSGVYFPFHNHSRYSETAWQQVEITTPFKKRLWQDIVKAKINNQADCLDILSRPHASKLREISKLVQSGDSKNSEAFAANLYWKSLFETFNRSDESDIRNAALNYGYAIVRGCVARSVVGAGLLPCFGLHHANKLNPFNLVDDLMEPFRPFVDYMVFKLNFEKSIELTPESKNKIVEVLTQNCIFNNEEINLLKACELTATSLAKAIKVSDPKMLQVPILKKITFI